MRRTSPLASRRLASSHSGASDRAARFVHDQHDIRLTISPYRRIYPRYQAMTATEPAVKTATAYYEANIGSVTSIQDFVGNYRLLSYALDAYGLGDQINAA